MTINPLSITHTTGANTLSDILPPITGPGPVSKTLPSVGQYLPVSAAIIADLEQQQREIKSQIREFESHVEPEKREQKEAAKDDLNELAVQRSEIKKSLNDLAVQETRIWDLHREAASASEERTEFVRTMLLEEVAAELRERKALYAELVLASERDRNTLDAELHQQESKAAIAYATAGLRFRVDDPIRLPALTPEIVAAEQDSVMDGADAAPIQQSIAWGVTAISGIAAGISLGLAAKFLHADTLHREKALMGMCSLFGIATSTALKYGMESVWREVSLRLNAGKSWYASAACAGALTSFVIMIYSTVEKRGMMAGMLIEMVTQNIRGGRPLDTTQIQIAATFGSLFLTVPYVLLVSSNGFRKGRYAVNAERARGKLLREKTTLEDTQRSSPEIKKAFEEGGQVTTMLARIERFDARSKAGIDRIKSEISRLEDRKTALMEEVCATPTPRQAQLQLDIARMESQRLQLEDELKSIEASKQQIEKKTKEITPSQAKIEAARKEADLKASRVAWEQDKARNEIEQANGSLWQRLKWAVKKPKIGTLHFQPANSDAK